MTMTGGTNQPPPTPTPSPTPAPTPSPTPTPNPSPGGGLTVGATPGAVGYTMVSSYDTVQSLSPTTTLDVVYCAIQTQPHGVIASMPVDQTAFNAGAAGFALADYADAIETLMADPRVIAGTGEQTIDPSGLLQDAVNFTVQYTDPVLAPYGITAVATVPNTLLNFTNPPIGATQQAAAVAIIDGVYTNLQATAAG